MTISINRSTRTLSSPGEQVVCASPDCGLPVGDDPWEESSRHCWSCAIERDLWDRETRWDRLSVSDDGGVSA